MEDYIENCIVQAESVKCNGSVYILEEDPLSYTDTMFWLFCGGYMGLVLMAGLMSGLTMGLLSLDLTSLKVLQEGGKPHEQKHAEKIIPLVQRHHLLLVTLLLGNAAAVEAMPVCLNHISNPITAILVSVTAVLIFGEVAPQALCTRYGLAIGAFFTPFVYFLMGVTFVVSYPISKLLDIILGEDHGTFYRRAELKVLVGMHGPQPSSRHHSNSANEDPLSRDEVIVIKGALEMREKKVIDSMVPVQQVFMLSTETVLCEATMKKILLAGHSRIPIFEITPEKIVGVLLVKSLLCLNTQQGIVLKDMLNTKCIRTVHRVYDSMPLFELLDVFQTGKCHLSIVHSSENINPQDSPLLEPDENSLVLGIITLEDVIEELIQEEIYDEKDVPDSRIQTGHIIRLARRNFLSPWKFQSEGHTLRTTGSFQEIDEHKADSDYTCLIQPDRFDNAVSLP